MCFCWCLFYTYVDARVVVLIVCVGRCVVCSVAACVGGCVIIVVLYAASITCFAFVGVGGWR